MQRALFVFGVTMLGCYAGPPGGGGGDGDDDGGSESADDGGDDDTIGASCEQSDGVDPGPMYLRRLTHREYEATVRDLLGVDPGPAVATFPADVVTSTFDNNGLNQTIAVLLGERYLSAAKAFAAEVVADENLRASVIGCDPADTGCVDEFVTRFGERAFRRPLTDEEIAQLVALAQTQSDPLERASIVIEAVLQSPKFLFRVEVGVEDPEHPERASSPRQRRASSTTRTLSRRWPRTCSPIRERRRPCARSQNSGCGSTRSRVRRATGRRSQSSTRTSRPRCWRSWTA
jgi:hypothetical protein